MRYVSLCLALAISCGDGGDGKRAPAAPGTQGGSSSTGGKKSTATHGAGEAGDTGAGGDPESQGGSHGGGEGGASIVYEEDDPPMFEPGLCDPAMMPGDDEPVLLGLSDARLLAMTPDELSAVLTTADGGEPKLLVADRGAVSESFTETEVAIPTGFEAKSGVSLSSDGTRLVLVRQDHTGFGELVREARGEAFASEADETRFAFLNMLSSTTGRFFSWPLLAGDGETLYYVTTPAPSLVEVSRTEEGVFKLGAPIDMYTLGGPEGEYKFLTGLSSDERAIFFHDEATGHAMALFRQYEDAPFYNPLDLGEREGVVPNADCTRLYSSSGGGLVFQTVE